jgi:hypothetical protein
MDSTTLVAGGIDIDGGARLIRQLDETGFPVVAALWSYDTGAADWRLLLASPRVQHDGPRRAYQDVQRQLLSLRRPGLSLGNVVVLSSEAPLVEALRKGYRDGGGAGTWIRGAVVGGEYIDHAYLYFVK